LIGRRANPALSLLNVVTVSLCRGAVAVLPFGQNGKHPDYTCSIRQVLSL